MSTFLTPLRVAPVSEDREQVEVLDAAGVFVCGFADAPAALQSRIARRIVACVNALGGIPTQTVKGMKPERWAELARESMAEVTAAGETGLPALAWPAWYDERRDEVIARAQRMADESLSLEHTIADMVVQREAQLREAKAEIELRKRDEEALFGTVKTARATVSKAIEEVEWLREITVDQAWEVIRNADLARVGVDEHA